MAVFLNTDFIFLDQLSCTYSKPIQTGTVSNIASNEEVTIEFEYSTDGGNTYKPLISETSYANGSVYTWTNCNIIAGLVFVKQSIRVYQIINCVRTLTQIEVKTLSTTIAEIKPFANIYLTPSPDKDCCYNANITGLPNYPNLVIHVDNIVNNNIPSSNVNTITIETYDYNGILENTTTINNQSINLSHSIVRPTQKSYKLYKVIYKNVCGFEIVKEFKIDYCDSYILEEIDCNTIKFTNLYSFPVTIDIFKVNINTGLLTTIGPPYPFEVLNGTFHSITLEDGVYSISLTNADPSVDIPQQVFVLDCKIQKCIKNVLANYLSFKDTCDKDTYLRLITDLSEVNLLKDYIYSRLATFKNMQQVDEINWGDYANDFITVEKAIDRLLSVCSDCGRIDIFNCNPSTLSNKQIIYSSKLPSLSDCGCK